MANKEQGKPQQGASPEELYRQWTFQSHNPGLHQVLLPSRKDRNGDLIEPQVEANFGGDSGREGMWRVNDKFRIDRLDSKEPVTGKELVAILRAKVLMKPVVDCNILELTVDKDRGDPVYKPTEGEDDAVSQPSR